MIASVPWKGYQMNLFRKLLGWISQPDVRDRIVVTFIAAVLVAAFWWLLKHTKRLFETAMNRLVSLVRGTTSLDLTINQYRRTLELELFQIQHAWMKEGQQLKDILVPVVVQSDRLSGGIEDWSIVLNRYFGQTDESRPSAHRRLAVLGGPGSGKSVALKLAAREVWRLPAPNNESSLIPIVLTFSEYRRAGFDLLVASVGSLRTRGFHLATEAEERTFVEENLRGGRLFLIVDALDELELADRKTATERLTADLKRFPVAAMFSCRTAAWHNQFSDVGRDIIEMADFTPAAIRQFLRQWDFPPPKTSDELIDTVESQPHIAELARSPLMLTIIAFLYSQPKYHLPQNRAEFYDICSRALLEEWDQHRNPDRANRFERHHKEYVLSELAYEHLCGPTPDADLDERVTLQTISEVMKRYSLREGENLKLLDEIRENSGLLVRLPPSGLRFPHQTFLEFFAALWLIRQNDKSIVFDRYDRDPQRWREVLLLYIGLNTNTEDASLAVEHLNQNGSLEMALSALVNSRAIKPSISGDVLEKCALSLGSTLDAKLITLLGYVAANPRTAHAEKAASILRQLLRSVTGSKSASPAVLEALLLASLRRPTENITRFIVEHLAELQVGRILPQMGERGFVLTAKVIGDRELALEKKLEWVEGLRRAEGVRPLLHLLVQKEIDPAIASACAVALLRLSKLDVFSKEAESFSETHRLTDSHSILKRWGWPFRNPKTPAGRRLMVYLARRASEHDNLPAVLTSEIEKEVDSRLLYLALALQKEEGKYDSAINSPLSDSSNFVLRSIWQKSCSPGWTKWVDWLNSDLEPPLLFGFFAGAVASAWSLIGFVLGAMGYSSLGLRWPAGIAVFTIGIAIGILFILAEEMSWANLLIGVIIGPGAIPIGYLSKGRFSRWFGDILTIAILVSLALVISQRPTIRIIFAILLTAQFVAVTRLETPRATHPIAANKVTGKFSQQLLASDREL